MNRYPWLDAYLLAKPGAEKDFKAEWRWLRYRVAERLFAAVCCPDERYGPHAGREMVILKCEPALAELLRAQYADVVPGFYSDKRHWNSVYLDGAVPGAVLRGMCDQSYRLVVEKLPKWRQRELQEGAPGISGRSE